MTDPRQYATQDLENTQENHRTTYNALPLNEFYQKVLRWIDLMRYAMRGLEATQENHSLRYGLKDMKRNSKNEKTDYAKVNLFFLILNNVIKSHQQNSALIPIIIYLKKYILNKFKIRLETNNSYSSYYKNSKLQQLYTEFLKSTEHFKVPTKDEKEKKETYTKFMDRINNALKNTQLKTAEQQLEIVVRDPNYPKLLRINGYKALKYVNDIVHVTNVDQYKQYKLAKLLDNTRYLILELANPEFQSQLTEATLLNICGPCGEHLVSLYLNGCQNISSLNEVLSNLTKLHPNLKTLYIQGLSNLTKVWKTIGSYHFPNLTELYLKDCPKLESFKIDTPNLCKLQVINCLNLEKLTTQNDNVNSDSGINDYVIESCPKLTTKFELPPSCFIELLSDYADFQASEVDATESLRQMYGEVSRGNYDLMFFGNSRKTNERKQGEKILADFDKHLQTLGITDKYLRDYVKLIHIQGAGKDILGPGKNLDLSFAYAASRLLCQKLNEVIRSYIKSTESKIFTTGISNLKPKKTYDAKSKSVRIEFADSLSVYINGKQIQLGFARYSITLYADRSKLPEFICNLDLYNSVTVTIAGQKLRPAEIFNPNNIRSLFENAFTALNDKDFLDEEMLFRTEQIAQLMPCYAALHAKLFPMLAISKYGTQNARFAILYLTNWLIDSTKSLPTNTMVKQVNSDTINYFAATFNELFVVEDHTIKLYCADEYYNSGTIPKIVTPGFFIFHQENQNSLSFK